MSLRASNMADDNMYWDNGHIRGRCSVCYETKQHRQAKNPKYFKPYYFRVFEKINWFRGDDEYLGMICKKCLKDGRLLQVNKFHPNQLEEQL